MNRGADRQDVFVADADFDRFEWLLGDAAMACGVEVHAYCLMTNHFHLLLHCPMAGLSEVMQSIQFRYAQWFNQRYERDGPVFRGRFRSVLVTDDEQLGVVGRYVHRNPLALMRPQLLPAYRWSSLGVYLGRRPAPEWLRTDELIKPFGRDVAEFRRFVEVDLPSDHVSAPWWNRPTCCDVEKAVADSCGLPVESLRCSTPGASNLARTVAIGLCVELRVATTAELAQHFGVSSQSSVRSIARRGRILVAADPAATEIRHRALARMGRGGPATLGA